jgi:hypothetical protein
LQDSFQRRAILRAEGQISAASGRDEHDLADEEAFLQESGELHFNLSDLLCALFRTHSSAFFPVYMDHWNEVVCNLCCSHCLSEDQQFAASIICDVVEFGLNDASAEIFIEQTFTLLCEVCTNTVDYSPRRNCAYALGIMCEKFSRKMLLSSPQRAMTALAALGRSIAKGEGEGAPRGAATDNAVSAVGILLEQLDMLRDEVGLDSGVDLQLMWGQWLAYLPLRDDTVRKM